MSIKNIVAAVGAAINSVVDLLPASIASRVHQGRKSLVGIAGAAATLLAAVDPNILPPAVAPWVAGALVIATGIATWAVPNDTP